MRDARMEWKWKKGFDVTLGCNINSLNEIRVEFSLTSIY